MAIGRKLSLTPNVKSKKINVTATADQTLFTVTGGYRINNIGVYRNGALLAVGKDFLANDGSTVTLLTAATVGDIVQFEIFDTHDLVNSIGANGDQVLNGALTVTGIVSASSINIGSAITFTDAGINVTGVVTATNFEGDGSGLTGVANTDFVVSTATTTSRLVVSNGITVGVITATQFKGEGANITSLNASNLGSGTVPTARLGSGTASSSTFLRGDSTFAAVTSTTINSNANNRVITGSDSADTLEAESALTFDGTLLKLQVDSGEFRVEAANGVDAFSVDSDNGNTSIAGNTSLGIGKSVNYGSVQKAFVQDHAVGVGTTNTAGRNAGLGTAVGAVIFNAEASALQVYHGDAFGWVDATGTFSASGGSITGDRSGYTVHEFTSPGTFTVSAGSADVEVMVIGGGGSGGGNPGSGGNGGGGAGAIYMNNSVPVSTGSYSVTVGSGGPGARAKGSDGGDSAFGPSYPAAGGGGGGMRGDSPGRNGGSGGGAGCGPTPAAGGTASGAAGGSASGNSPTAGWGNPGGTVSPGANGVSNFPAGGGGGASAAGTNAPDQGPGQGGPGGNGLVMAIEGPSQTFAGGGGGGTHQSGPQPSGGSGGGGYGSVQDAGGGDAPANSGSGGGGAGANGSGGSGGSGKVVIAYQS